MKKIIRYKRLIKSILNEVYFNKRVGADIYIPPEVNFIYDIGANKGDYTYRYLKKSKKVLSIEPQKHLYLLLIVRFFRNILQRQLTVKKIAISDKKGTADFFLPEKWHQLGTISKEYTQESRFKDMNWNKVKQVKTTTLDDLIEKYGMPQYIKIDIEGNEIKALDGLHSFPKILSLEANIDDYSKIVDMLEIVSKNYKYFNFIKETSTTLEFDNAIELQQLKKFLKNYKNEYTHAWGDIYCYLHK